MLTTVTGPAGPISFGGSLPFVLIAGPCQLESRDHALGIAERLKAVCEPLQIPFIFKASYDKANRTRAEASRGPGIAEGVEILHEVRSQVGVPVTTDVHNPDDVEFVAAHVDLLQIPALLSRQTDLLTAAGQHAAAVNIKKGQFMSPPDAKYPTEKVRRAGCDNVLLTERGTSFGYGRLVNDMTALPLMMNYAPVVFDATHSVQARNAREADTGGDRIFVPCLARAAVAVGVSGVFIECHEEPDSAPSDGGSMMRLAHMPALLAQLANIDELVKGRY